MKQKLIIIIAVVVAVGGFMFWFTSPRYEVLADNIHTFDYSVSPAKVKVDNIWRGRPVEFILNIDDMDVNAIYNVRNESEVTGYRWYIYPTDFGMALNQQVTVRIDKIAWSVPQGQSLSLRISENGLKKQGSINIEGDYIVNILLP